MNASMLSGYSTIYFIGLGPGQIRFMNEDSEPTFQDMDANLTFHFSAINHLF